MYQNHPHNVPIVLCSIVFYGQHDHYIQLTYHIMYIIIIKTKFIVILTSSK